MKKGTEKLVKSRFEAALAASRFKNERRLALDIPVDESQIQRWRDGFTTPTGENLRRLCELLEVSANYLFGEEETDARKRIINDAKLSLGPSESLIIEALGKVSPTQRALIQQRVIGMVDIWTSEGLDPHLRETNRAAPEEPAPAPGAFGYEGHDDEEPSEEPVATPSPRERPGRKPGG